MDQSGSDIHFITLHQSRVVNGIIPAFPFPRNLQARVPRHSYIYIATVVSHNALLPEQYGTIYILFSHGFNLLQSDRLEDNRCRFSRRLKGFFFFFSFILRPIYVAFKHCNCFLSWDGPARNTIIVCAAWIKKHGSK